MGEALLDLMRAYPFLDCLLMPAMYKKYGEYCISHDGRKRPGDIKLSLFKCFLPSFFLNALDVFP